MKAGLKWHPFLIDNNYKTHSSDSQTLLCRKASHQYNGHSSCRGRKKKKSAHLVLRGENVQGYVTFMHKDREQVCSERCHCQVITIKASTQVRQTYCYGVSILSIKDCVEVLLRCSRLQFGCIVDKAQACTCNREKKKLNSFFFFFSFLFFFLCNARTWLCFQWVPTVIRAAMCILGLFGCNQAMTGNLADLQMTRAFVMRKTKSLPLTAVNFECSLLFFYFLFYFFSVTAHDIITVFLRWRCTV